MIIINNINPFDLAIMLEGDLNNFVEDVMIYFKINKIDDDLAGLNITPLYNINNTNVKFFYEDYTNIATSNNQEFLEWTSNQGAFSGGFDSGFDI